MSFLSYRLKIPRPHPYWALGVVVLWSVSLIVVDAAARLEARRSMVLVKDAADCDLYRRPLPEEIVAQVYPGDPLWVRQTPKRGARGCYCLENAQGVRGWAPYNSAYLGSDGIDLRWRRFLARLW